MKKKTVLITGASSKLGSIIALTLAKRGYSLYAGYLSNSNNIPEHTNIAPVKLDITSDTEVDKVMKNVLHKSGSIDVLINIAGVTTSGKAAAFTSNEFKKLLRINTVSHLLVSNAAFKIMKKQKSKGHIINITSLSGLVALPGFSIYSASKFAAQALDTILHYEYAQKGVVVTNIAPGAINFGELGKHQITHKTLRQKFPFLQYILKMTTPQQIAETVERIIANKTGRSLLVMGFDAKIVYGLYRLCPRFIWDKLIFLYWNKK